jgi:hypothetical protein
VESVLLLAKVADSKWTVLMESRYFQNVRAMTANRNRWFRVEIKVTLGFCLTPEYLDFIV